MERSLLAEVERRGVAVIEDFREVALIPESYDDEKIFGLLNRYAEAYGEGLMLYGGITATERIYGLKRIREITTDLDFVCTEAGLEAVLSGERLFYHRRFDVLYAVADNVPVSFTFGHIHDWPIDEAFFEAAETRLPFGLPVSCCSREHSIMLKLRRMDERLRRGDQAFGKDALDILNMLVATVFKPGEEKADIPALCGLVLEWVSRDQGRLGRLLDFVRGYESHLSGPEREAAGPLLGAIAGGLGLGGA